MTFLSLACSLAVFAQNPSKVVVIGNATSLQKMVIGDKKTEFKTIAQSNETNDPAGTNSLDGVEALYLDVQQMPKGMSVKNQYVKEALHRHIPIVLENVDSKNLTEIAGVGIDAKVAIVESKSDKRGVNVTVVEGEARPKFRLAPAPGGTLPVSRDEGTGRLDKSKVDPEKLKKMEEDQKLAPPPPPAEDKGSDNKLNPAKTENNSSTLESLFNQTKEALEINKQKRINAAKGGRTGSLAPVLGDAYVSSLAHLDAKTINSTSYDYGYPVNVDLPEYAEFNISLDWLNKTWKHGSYNQKATVNISYDIVLYATTSPKQKYMKITTTGTGVNPGALLWNHFTDKGFFTESFWQQFGLYNGTNGTLQRTAPNNANNARNVSTTTGFSVGASVSADRSGPSTSVSAEYSSSTTISNDISDFEVTNSSDVQYAKFNYRMSSTPGGAYNRWQDLWKTCDFCNPGLHDLPSWAKNNMPAYAEGVWKFAPDYNGQELLYFYQHHYTRDTWLVSGDIFSWRYKTIGYNQRFDKFFTVDFSKVQLPHLGLDGTAQQSSVAFNGHPTRAIDGDIEGAWGGNSVTHTGNDQNAYLDIALNEAYARTVIGKLELWNRTDCCKERLQNFRIFVSDTPFSSTNLNETLTQVANSRGAIFMLNHPGAVDNFARFDLARTGRYIRIQLNGTGILSLAEVRVVPKGFF